MRIFVSLACVLALAACAAPPRATAVVEHAFGESFSVPVGAPVRVGREITVSFKEVVDDSRCPKQVTCVWQGVAKIRIEALMPGGNAIERREMELATTPDAERVAAAGGYRVELLDVTPWPEAPGRIDPRKYAATLQVTRDE